MFVNAALVTAAHIHVHYRVEIDEKITALAREYFELPADVPVTTYDGRAYLNAVDGKYDVIMVGRSQNRPVKA